MIKTTNKLVVPYPLIDEKVVDNFVQLRSLFVHRKIRKTRCCQKNSDFLEILLAILKKMHKFAVAIEHKMTLLRDISLRKRFCFCPFKENRQNFSTQKDISSIKRFTCAYSTPRLGRIYGDACGVLFFSVWTFANASLKLSRQCPTLFVYN